MTNAHIRSVIREARTWTSYLAAYLVACLVCFVGVLLSPALYSVVPVFVFLGISLFQLQGISKKLGDLDEALERSDNKR